jgi:hypothetical protein
MCSEWYSAARSMLDDPLLYDVPYFPSYRDHRIFIQRRNARKRGGGSSILAELYFWSQELFHAFLP